MAQEQVQMKFPQEFHMMAQLHFDQGLDLVLQLLEKLVDQLNLFVLN